jgi:Na+/phosphate symporter
MGYLPLIICILGLILYFVTEHPKVSAVSLAMFSMGLLAFLLLGSHLPR